MSEQRQKINTSLISYRAILFFIETSDCVSTEAQWCRWCLWQAADRPVLMSWHSTEGKWDREKKKKKSTENSEVFSPAWHSRCGFIESKMRMLSFWDVTVTAGWQMAFMALSGKHRGRDNRYEIKVSQMRESIQTKVTNCQFKLKYSATTTKNCGLKMSSSGGTIAQFNPYIGVHSELKSHIDPEAVLAWNITIWHFRKHTDNAASRSQ